MGSFRSEMPERVCDIANRLGLHVVELRGAFSPSQQAYIADRVRVVVRSVTWERLDVSPVAEVVEYIALPEEDEFDLWRACEGTLDAASARHVLARGLGPGTVAAALRHLPLGGVIAGSSVRSTSGLFDVLKAAEFFQRAREALDDPWELG
jgi:phosphoribosylanthranilate isomerase